MGVKKMVSCDFCGEEEAVTKRPNPNGPDEEKIMWDVCWECDKYIDWSMRHHVAMIMGGEMEPFDQWLFKREKVWPKGKSFAATISKQEK
jgi:hypothetical protein